MLNTHLRPRSPSETGSSTSLASTTISDIPAELLGRIFTLAAQPTHTQSEFDARKVLCRTSLVCRAWREESQRVLHQRLQVTATNSDKLGSISTKFNTNSIIFSQPIRTESSWYIPPSGLSLLEKLKRVRHLGFEGCVVDWTNLEHQNLKHLDSISLHACYILDKVFDPTKLPFKLHKLEIIEKCSVNVELCLSTFINSVRRLVVDATPNHSHTGSAGAAHTFSPQIHATLAQHGAGLRSIQLHQPRLKLVTLLLPNTPNLHELELSPRYEGQLPGLLAALPPTLSLHLFKLKLVPVLPRGGVAGALRLLEEPVSRSLIRPSGKLVLEHKDEKEEETKALRARCAAKKVTLDVKLL